MLGVPALSVQGGSGLQGKSSCARRGTGSLCPSPGPQTPSDKRADFLRLGGYPPPTSTPSIPEESTSVEPHLALCRLASSHTWEGHERSVPREPVWVWERCHNGSVSSHYRAAQGRGELANSRNHCPPVRAGEEAGVLKLAASELFSEGAGQGSGIVGCCWGRTPARGFMPMGLTRGKSRQGFLLSRVEKQPQPHPQL